MVANSPNFALYVESKSGPGLRVALYLRQSDKEQRLSIAQQRQECRGYAQSRGWQVVAEYTDDGRSGSKDLAKRAAFARLLDDAEQKGRKWQAVLCWDSSRFGRLDSQAGAPHKLRLRRAGVWLETTRGESIRWDTSMGRLLDALQSEQNNQYSLDLSRNAIRGRRMIHEMGFLARPTPYGFDRQYVEGDIVRHRCKRTEVFQKPRNWRLKPVPNEEEAAVVRWVFEQWAKRDMSFCGTLRELRDRGIPSPSGVASWTLAQVKRLLTEAAYVGDLHIGNGGRTKEVHARIGERTKQNALPALVDRATWNAVQKKVKAREGAEWRPKTASGALSSIVICGHCGYRLARRTYNGYQYFVCDSATKRPHTGCKQWRVCEDEILPAITAELVDAVDFEVLRRVTAQPEKRDHAEVERLKEQEKVLARQVQRAASNLLLIDSQNFKAAEQALTEIRREHERMANALRLAVADVPADHRRRWVAAWEEMREKLVTLPGKVTKHKMASLTWEMLGRRLLDKKDIPTTGRVYGVKVTGGTVEVVQPPVTLATDTLRDLLRRLSVQVHLHWELRNPGSAHPRYKLSTGVLRAQWQVGAEIAETTLDLPSDDSGSRARRRRRAA